MGWGIRILGGFFLVGLFFWEGGLNEAKRSNRSMLVYIFLFIVFLDLGTIAFQMAHGLFTWKVVFSLVYYTFPFPSCEYYDF